MGNLAAVVAGISTLEKLVPVMEAVAKEIGPTVQNEVKDGKQVWVDILQCLNDLKTALAAVKAAVAQ